MPAGLANRPRTMITSAFDDRDRQPVPAARGLRRVRPARATPAVRPPASARHDPSPATGSSALGRVRSVQGPRRLTRRLSRPRHSSPKNRSDSVLRIAVVHAVHAGLAHDAIAGAAHRVAQLHVLAGFQTLVEAADLLEHGPADGEVARAEPLDVASLG